MRMRVRGVMAVAILSWCVGCSSTPAGPSHRDDGSVFVAVTDQSGAPISGVPVHVHDLPNAVGSFYSIGQWTGTNGTTNISSITPGRHRVEVTPPPGFAAGPEGLVQEVDVGPAQVTSVAFRLRRS